MEKTLVLKWVHRLSSVGVPARLELQYLIWCLSWPAVSTQTQQLNNDMHSLPFVNTPLRIVGSPPCRPIPPLRPFSLSPSFLPFLLPFFSLSPFPSPPWTCHMTYVMKLNTIPLPSPTLLSLSSSSFLSFHLPSFSLSPLLLAPPQMNLLACHSSWNWRKKTTSSVLQSFAAPPSPLLLASLPVKEAGLMSTSVATSICSHSWRTLNWAQLEIWMTFGAGPTQKQRGMHACSYLVHCPLELGLIPWICGIMYEVRHTIPCFFNCVVANHRKGSRICSLPSSGYIDDTVILFYSISKPCHPTTHQVYWHTSSFAWTTSMCRNLCSIKCIGSQQNTTLANGMSMFTIAILCPGQKVVHKITRAEGLMC